MLVDGQSSRVRRDGDRWLYEIAGQFSLTTFINDAGLQGNGSNLFVATPASGSPQEGTPRKARSRRPATRARADFDADGQDVAAFGGLAPMRWTCS